MNCLISVFDKKGIVDFARKIRGVKIYSTSGTRNLLLSYGIEAKDISELSGEVEILGGKVKTLHSKIFAAILADEEEARELGMERFQVLVVNLYSPNLEPDIGGVSLIRAGIKAWQRTLVVVSPEDYDYAAKIIMEKKFEKDILWEFAKKAYDYVLKYQILNAIEYFGIKYDKVLLENVLDLRYGTNPPRPAHFSRNIFSDSPNFRILGESIPNKSISLNNLYDADAAIRCAMALKRSLGEQGVVVVKHGTISGAASNEDQETALKFAYESDEESAFGGIIGFSDEVDERSAKFLKDKFVEVIIAPKFSEKSLQILKNKKTRIIEYENKEREIMDIRYSLGGYLVEKYKDEEEDIADGDKNLVFVWCVARFVKSNAVVIGDSLRRTVGIGGGFTSRVAAARYAVEKAKEKKFVPPLYAASDGFFPFPDSIEVLSEIVKYVIQPGGSKRDSEVIKRSEELGVKMIITGKRCFRH